MRNTITTSLPEQRCAGSTEGPVLCCSSHHGSVSPSHRGPGSRPGARGVWRRFCHCRTAKSGSATSTPPTHNFPPRQSDHLQGPACNLLTGWQESVENPITP
ncbi:hypothetical protein PBY51_007634 [Eleginops maclovinus]|uniref:Uncharacterized protein n=1 Tax=Eleginops maclovinus TaxID=56733 RepID=A0AAN7X6T2_ELEMC|nr:hypothetical protein PBY51_007634 [Eleginops maclovinus]